MQSELRDGFAWERCAGSVAYVMFGGGWQAGSSVCQSNRVTACGSAVKVYVVPHWNTIVCVPCVSCGKHAAGPLLWLGYVSLHNGVCQPTRCRMRCYPTLCR